LIAGVKVTTNTAGVVPALPSTTETSAIEIEELVLTVVLSAAVLFVEGESAAAEVTVVVFVITP
jgi:hypothetical protein